MSQNIRRNRSKIISKNEIKILSKMSYELYSILNVSQNSFSYDTLFLSKNKLEELSDVLIEFAEDIICKVGIWESLEFYNKSLFNTPLPYSLPVNNPISDQAISRERIHYLLWNKYTELLPDYLIYPNHKDLNFLVDVVNNYFYNNSKLTSLKNSTLSEFLNDSNQYGWDVKRKLIWLGKHSYLFRQSYKNYINENDGKEDILVIDDFVCQNSTNWSGLSVPDILANLLDISNNERNDLRSWDERHFSYFKIEKIKGDLLEVNNIVNNTEYIIRAGAESNLFKPGHIIIGSLVPWKEEWYWSGQQSDFGELSSDEINDFKNDFIKNSPQIVYRYASTLLKKAKESINLHYQNFIKYHNDSIKVFSDGYAMAAAIQKQHRLEYESFDEKDVDEVMKKQNLKNPWPNYNYPQELLDSNDGIGLFFNPDEGQEMKPSFNDLLSGLEKNGKNLKEEEIDSIRGFITSKSISVNFVKKLSNKYGDKSILETFLIRDRNDMDYLEYILRKYKGKYYRNRYPNLSFC